MKITIPYSSLASIKTKEGTRTIMYVDVTCVPSDIPMECNPRLQNMNSSVVKDMRNTLLEDDGLFHILNRGITITAEKLSVDEKEKVAVIDIEDIDTQGCIDGGHTYKCILENKVLLQPGVQMVTIEVLEGEIVTNNFTKLAMARNRSQQVQDKSIAELERQFNWIKDTISNEPVNVIYKENDSGDISVEFVLWLMTVTNPRFGDAICNARKGSCMTSYTKYYKKYGTSTLGNPYYACKDILIDLMKVYDFVEVHFGDDMRYLTKKVSKISAGKYKSTIYRTTMRYKVPKQFLYPIFTVMSVIIGIDNETGLLFWKIDPYDFIKRALPKLAEHQVEIFRSDKLLERCRSKETYENLKMKGENIYKDIMLEKLISEK